MATLTIEPNDRVTYRVRHEDADVLVVDKPARLVTQPGVGHEHDTLLNGLFARWGAQLQNLGAKRDFGLVHRLDKETSGLVVVALSPTGYDSLRAQFAGRTVQKRYWAICHKPPGEPEGVVRLPIEEVVERKGRYTSTKTGRVVRNAADAGKAAITAYRVVQASELGALVEARPVTGRLHQVRLHLAAIGAGVLGDELYAPKNARAACQRLCLHACRLRFEHPVTGETVEFRSHMPKELRQVLRRLDLDVPNA